MLAAYSENCDSSGRDSSSSAVRNLEGTDETVTCEAALQH